jgi:hypothetical protein
MKWSIMYVILHRFGHFIEWQKNKLRLIDVKDVVTIRHEIFFLSK